MSNNTRAELHGVNSKIKLVTDHIANLQKLLAHLEAKRDSLILAEADNEGACDRRKVAVR